MSRSWTGYPHHSIPSGKRMPRQKELHLFSTMRVMKVKQCSLALCSITWTCRSWHSASGLAMTAALGSYDLYDPNKRKAEGPETMSQTQLRRQKDEKDGVPPSLGEQGAEEVS